MPIPDPKRAALQDQVNAKVKWNASEDEVVSWLWERHSIRGTDAAEMFADARRHRIGVVRERSLYGMILAGIATLICAGMIAAQMGDTRYRGRILWMLLTARPDLLPIDLKRQGRAEVHIPLFYPSDEREIRQMFVVMAAKLGSKLAPEDVPTIPQRGHLSGADIEGIVGRAWRTSLLAGHDRVTREALAGVVSQFMPSTQGLERELQETAAMIECTDRQFLPAEIWKKMEGDGSRAKLQTRLTALKQLVGLG